MTVSVSSHPRCVCFQPVMSHLKYLNFFYFTITDMGFDNLFPSAHQTIHHVSSNLIFLCHKWLIFNNNPSHLDRKRSQNKKPMQRQALRQLLPQTPNACYTNQDGLVHLSFFNEEISITIYNPMPAQKKIFPNGILFRRIN